MKTVRDFGEQNPVVISCLPKSEAKYVIKDAVVTNCELCEIEVYCSPVALRKQRSKEAHIVCNNCMNKAFDTLEEGEIVMKGYVGKDNIEEFERPDNLPLSLALARLHTSAEGITRVPVKDPETYRKKR